MAGGYPINEQAELGTPSTRVDTKLGVAYQVAPSGSGWDVHVDWTGVETAAMPQRTNDFQTLIALIERQLAAAGVEVTESKMVRDEAIGEEREVDVYLATKSGEKVQTIGIECVAHKRQADITWVEGRIQKHRDIGTDQVVLVSESGFTKAARKKAEQYGAAALTLEQASEADWSSLPRGDISIQASGARVESVGIAVPYDAQLVVEVPRGEPSSWSGDADSLGTVLYGPDGGRLGTAKELLERAKSTPAILEDFMRRAPRSGDEAPLEFAIRLPQGSYWLDGEGDSHHLISLRFRGIGRLEKDDIPLRPGRYRDKVLLSGSADVGGSRHVVSALHPSDTRFSLGVSLSPGTEPIVLELEVSPGDTEGE